MVAKARSTKKKGSQTPSKPSNEPRRERHSGGLYTKTGYYIEEATGESKAYTYYQAAREVPVKDLRPDRKGTVRRKRITGSGRTKSEALARLEENWLAYYKGEPTPRTVRSSKPNLTLADLFEKWDKANRIGRVSPTMTVKYQGYFKNHILPALGDRKIGSITQNNLLRFLGSLEQKKNPKTGEQMLGSAARRNIFMALSGFFKWAVAQDYLLTSPMKGIPVEGKQKPTINIEEASVNARKLLERLGENRDADYCRWLLQFLGLRRAERLGLSWSCIEGINTDTPVMVIRQQLARDPYNGSWSIKKKTKSGAVRRILIPEPFLGALREHKSLQDEQKKSADWKPDPQFADLVFLQPNGNHYTLNRDNLQWARLLKDYELPYWRGHLNRFITASWLAAQNPAVPTATVQSVLGHETEAMTFYYSQTTVAQQRAPMAKYGEEVFQALSVRSKSSGSGTPASWRRRK